jgi:hypothetical protein
MLQRLVEPNEVWLKTCTRDQYIPTGSDGFHRNSVKYIGSQLEQETVECNKFHWGIVILSTLHLLFIDLQVH